MSEKKPEQTMLQIPAQTVPPAAVLPWDDATPTQAEGALIVAPEEETAVAMGNRQFSQKPDFSNEDVLVPRLRLAQGLSSEVQNGAAKPGEWLLSGYDPEPEVRIVPFLIGKMREYRADNEEREIVCFSRDASTGEGTPGGECRSCLMNKWSETREGRRIPPPCSVFYSYLCFSITHQAPVIVEFRRTGLNAARQINSIIQARGLGNFGLLLGKISQKGPKGSYYVPTIGLLRIEPEELEAYRQQIQA